MNRLNVAEDLEFQARACASLDSPLYAAMLTLAGEDYRNGGATHDFFSDDPSRAQRSMPSLRLLAAFHALALDGRAERIAAHLPSCGGDGDAAQAWAAGRALLANDATTVAQLFEQPLQTNEVARATPLLAALHYVVRATQKPLRLFEVGASAGLLARLDAYHYEAMGWEWGDAASPLTLRNRTHSGQPRFADDFRVVERRASDVAPLDLDNAHDRTRLLSFVWADQLHRFERLKAACDAASTMSLHVERADCVAWTQDVAKPEAGATTVVMHAVMLEHLDMRARAAFERAVSACGQHANDDARFAWVRMEYDRARNRFETRVTLWPTLVDRLIATSDGHAEDITWSGA